MRGNTSQGQASLSSILGQLKVFMCWLKLPPKGLKVTYSSTKEGVQRFGVVYGFRLGTPTAREGE